MKESKNIGLLILRVGLGLSMATHGLQKWVHFTSFSQQFPLGLGSEFSLGLAVFAELFCSVFVAFGFFTRLSSIPVVITMLVAFFVAHGGDPFAKREMAFIYLVGFLALFFVGGGRFSLSRCVPSKTGLLGFFIESSKCCSPHKKS
jgi:putative oxidoreductase